RSRSKHARFSRHTTTTAHVWRVSRVDELERHAQRRFGRRSKDAVVEVARRVSCCEVRGLGIEVDDRDADGPGTSSQLFVGLGNASGSERLDQLELRAARRAE